MIAPTLPAELKAALDGKLQGFSRTDAAQRSQKISTSYRAGGGSGTIKTEADALAYALARMPATYAAVAASLNALTEIREFFFFCRADCIRKRISFGLIILKFGLVFS